MADWRTRLAAIDYWVADNVFNLVGFIDWIKIGFTLPIHYLLARRLLRTQRFEDLPIPYMTALITFHKDWKQRWDVSSEPRSTPYEMTRMFDFLQAKPPKDLN